MSIVPALSQCAAHAADAEAFPQPAQDATPEAFAAEAASEEAARTEDADAGYGFDD